MGVLGAWTFVAQADLASWQDAPSVVIPLVVAFAVAVVQLAPEEIPFLYFRF